MNTLIFLAGVSATVIGVGLIFLPAAFIVGGATAATAALLLERAE